MEKNDIRLCVLDWGGVAVGVSSRKQCSYGERSGGRKCELREGCKTGWSVQDENAFLRTWPMRTAAEGKGWVKE